MVHVTGDAISEGIRVTERARDAFGNISSAAAMVSQMMDSVALSSSEQQQGIAQVSKAMAQMDDGGFSYVIDVLRGQSWVALQTGEDGSS